MQLTITILALLVSLCTAQQRQARAQLGNLGASQKIILPDLGSVQEFLPSSLVNGKNVKLKITKKTETPRSFGFSTQGGAVGDSFGFSSSGGFSSNGVSANSNTGHGDTFQVTSQGSSGIGGNFDLTSPARTGNFQSGVSLDSFNFFDKNLQASGEHVSSFPLIPVNVSATFSPVQFGVSSNNFQGHSTGTTIPANPQHLIHNQASFSGSVNTNFPTIPTTTPAPPSHFDFSAHVPPVPVVNDLVHPPTVHNVEFNPPVVHPQTVHNVEFNPPVVHQDQIFNRNEVPSEVSQFPVLSDADLEETLQRDWDDFRTRFNKVYASEGEVRYRREIFIENRAKIMRFNMEYAEGRRNFVFRINEFADMLLHEFTNNLNGFNRTRRAPTVPLKPASTFVPSANVVFPESVDWRMVGAVGPVKSQGKCAACWAFAAAGALEGHHFRKTGSLVEVSVQNLIDCTEPYGNNGCAGGLMDPAFEYVRDNNGVDSEQSYPFEERNAECRFRREDVVATCTGFVDIGENDEKGLEIALATLGPVTAAIDAGQPTFQFYSEGIYDDPACGNKPEQMNHAVLIVGYGQEADGRKYWLVKNSYGPNWGIGGYMKLAKDNNNQCGIAIQASYPLV